MKFTAILVSALVATAAARGIKRQTAGDNVEGCVVTSDVNNPYGVVEPSLDNVCNFTIGTDSNGKPIPYTQDFNNLTADASNGWCCERGSQCLPDDNNNGQCF